MSIQSRTSLPFFVWPVFFLCGALVATASLSYSPEGRINILWVWLLWAGLPLLASIAAFVMSQSGSSRPWLFQWREHSVSWYPSRTQRLRMLFLLQCLWCMAVVGMFCAYWIVLLFSDIAFGWSSTLITDADTMNRLVRGVAWPWRAWWPEAVPGSDIIEGTRYLRIDPRAGSVALVTEWWRFLMAGLIFYNFLPRLVLAVYLYIRWRRSLPAEVQVRSRSGLSYSRGAQPDPAKKAHNGEQGPGAFPGFVPGNRIKAEKSRSMLREEQAEAWQGAAQASWELPDSDAAYQFGLTGWAEDEAALEQMLQELKQQPSERLQQTGRPHSEGKNPRLLWLVDSLRSPVAEMSDLVTRARAAGVTSQALLARTQASTDVNRHLASWKAFALKHHLVWITGESRTDSSGEQP